MEVFIAIGFVALGVIAIITYAYCSFLNDRICKLERDNQKLIENLKKELYK